MWQWSLLFFRRRRGVWSPVSLNTEGFKHGRSFAGPEGRNPSGETSFPPGCPYGSSPGVSSKRTKTALLPLLSRYLGLLPHFLGHRNYHKQQPEMPPGLPVPRVGHCGGQQHRLVPVASAPDIPHPMKEHNRLPQFTHMREDRSCQPTT